MNQHEVMELMQRHLDNDLGEKELDLLMEHLDDDPESKEMFERMQLLSGNLANLPRVSPPQSIVDSIMPELDRLEQEKQIQNQAVKKPRNTKRFWTYSSGIAVAAAVLGLFIFYGDFPEQRPDAGERMSSNNVALDEAAIFEEDEDHDKVAPMITGLERNSSSTAAEQDSGGDKQKPTTMMDQSEDHSADSANRPERELMQRTTEEAGSESTDVDAETNSLSFIYEAPDKDDFVAPDEPPYFSPLSSPDEKQVAFLRLEEDGWYLAIEDESGDQIAGQGPIYAEQMLEWDWNEDSDKLSARFISGEQEFWIHLELP